MYILDLSKAFDTVSHKILLEKLEFYELNKHAILLLKSYLTDRYQRVYFNGKWSQLDVLCMVYPKGLFLGQLYL